MFNRDKKIFVFISLLLVRIPLSHIIGDNGLGFLSGPMEIYWCVLLLFGYGITTSMAGMMRERIKRDQIKNADIIYSIGKKYILLISLLVLLIGILGFNFIGSRLLADAGSRMALFVATFAIVLGLINDLNIGFLIGTDNVKAAVLGELIDAISIFVCIILGAKLGSVYGTKIAALLQNEEVSAMYGAMGAMIGLCAGQFIALIALVLMNIIYQRTFKHLIRTDISRRTEYNSDVIGQLASGIVIDGLLAFLLQIPIIILLIMYRKHGISNGAEDVGAMVGAFYGKYLSIVGVLSALAVMPVAVSIKGIIVATNDSDDQLAGERISRLFGRVMYSCIPTAIFVTMLVNPIVSTLFEGRTTSVINALNIGCAVIVLYPLLYTFIAILNRLGYGKEMLFISALAVVLTVISGIFLVRRGNLELKGVTLVIMIEYTFITLFSLFILIRNYRLHLRLLQQVVIPVVVSGVLGILIRLLAGLLFDTLGGVLTLAICIIPAWLIYNLICMFLRVVSVGAMEHKFLGRILVRLGTNIGIY